MPVSKVTATTMLVLATVALVAGARPGDAMAVSVPGKASTAKAAKTASCEGHRRSYRDFNQCVSARRSRGGAAYCNSICH